MQIRELSTLQIIFVYNSYMKKDFPPDELKSLKMILDMMDRGIYECLGLYRDEEFVAYAFLVRNWEKKTLLLDYLAVCEEHRNSGYGRIFLEKMQEYYREERVLLLECESERTASDEEQRSIRRRRIGFYKRNGCRATRAKSWMFQVEYDILYLPLSEKEPDVELELELLYRRMFPSEMFANERYARFWSRHGILSVMSGMEQGSLVERASLCSALGIADGGWRVISLVGGGGKTSTMFQLADELFEEGRKVLVTTSTHIRRPEKEEKRTAKTVDEAVRLAADSDRAIVILGKSADDGKFAAPDGLDRPEEMDRLLAAFDVILIEADGAKCLPIKVPADYEPVIVPATELVIACAGLDAAGQTFGAACFRFREAGQWLNRPEDGVITAVDMAGILAEVRGAAKSVDGRDYRIVLNKADKKAQMDTAQEVIAALPQKLQDLCAVTSYGQ